MDEMLQLCYTADTSRSMGDDQMKILLDRDLRHRRRDDKLGWVLLVTLTVLLVMSLLVGIHSLGSA